MTSRAHPADGRERFDELYTTHYAAIYAYVHRRLGAAAGEVPDVVAEVFAVAWRKLEVVPQPPQDRLWLYGVARRRVRRAQRAGARYLRLQARLREHARDTTASAQEPRTAVGDAIAGLGPGDREALMLVMWEGLSHAEAAAVIGCSANAVALRISRARRRLRAELGSPGQTVRIGPEPEACS